MKNLKDFDFEAPDALRQLAEMTKEHHSEGRVLRESFIEGLTEAQLEQFYAILSNKTESARLEGVQYALGRIRRTNPENVEHLEQRVKNQAAKLNELQQAMNRQKAKFNSILLGKDGKIAHLERKLAEHRPARLEYAPPQPTPDWDYKTPAPRIAGADELQTNAPSQVELAARLIEEYVTRVGSCRKPDISSRYPTFRPYLAAAYKHLHLSKRVRVEGWRLGVWAEAVDMP